MSQSMDMFEMGNKIASTRRAKKLTQLDVANSLGMSRATISTIEKGTVKEVGIRKYMAVCAYLGLELNLEMKHSRPTMQQLLKEQQHA
jgi:HTH-type transcriptional regulator / antitoxin HipB